MNKKGRAIADSAINKARKIWLTSFSGNFQEDFETTTLAKKHLAGARNDCLANSPVPVKPTNFPVPPTNAKVTFPMSGNRLD